MRARIGSGPRREPAAPLAAARSPPMAPPLSPCNHDLPYCPLYLPCRRVLTLCRPAVLPPRLAVQPRHTGLLSAALIAMRNSLVMPSRVSACAPDLVTILPLCANSHRTSPLLHPT